MSTDEVPRSSRSRARHDLRAVALGVVAWAAALATLRLPHATVASGWLLGAGAATWFAVRRGPRPEHLAWLGVALVVGLVTALRAGAVHGGPVDTLAQERAVAQVTLRVTSDPAARDGRFGGYVLLRGSVRQLVARGRSWQGLREPVLVLAPRSWAGTRWGQTLRSSARLGMARGDDLAALVTPRGPPAVVAEPAPWWRVVDRVRHGVRDATAPAGRQPGALVPALVDGDEAGLSQQTRTEFQTTGMTHLLAVSGTNLTLVVGALLLLARSARVRARGLVVVGALGVVGFVMLARPEPSVLRAAAMGSVALLGMGSGGTTRAGRTLGVAVLVLMLVDPWLAQQVGFALSALATTGIVYLAPGWREAMCRWLPRWAAEAFTVPLAAQLVCTPVVASLSGQVSLVAVVANLLAAPVVGPATVLGLAGGVLSALWAPLGVPLGVPAGWCASWLLLVAHRGAALPTAAVGWSADPVSLLVLSLVCVALALAMRGLLARRVATVGTCAVALAAMVVPGGLPTPGWPPGDWVMVACDVGQGDGLVLRVADGVGIVVDTGPDPQFIDNCLRRLHVSSVPLVVLTHFHADHVGGLTGVLRGRRVGLVEVTTFDQPAAEYADVVRETRAAGVASRVVQVGEKVHLGALTWQVLAPSGPPPDDSDSPPNDASIAMLVRTRGITILLTGDQEPWSQERLAQVVPGLRVDVLKVAHHGSAKQDPDLVRALRPRLAVISVGVRNVYGHPAPSTLRLLAQAGASVARTDTEGDVAVTVDGGGRLGTAHRMPAVRPPPGGVG
ncbi:MBL fold metallo-hydrolase [Nocardioides mangrovicus]|uniref:MBL fold metallo-hydrolase n=1 Tax=Nocardioides mangrovicus TaxID=2478913 RepID=A0A3L8P5D7_9ACTN|nr:ComEC/Rec2 family competence protein [Nocardioides mangrovicus]RLV49608.1 MBL fold metallo-hydrolase [Nocardioides mangrovicus]